MPLPLDPEPLVPALDCATLCLVPLAPQVHALHRLHAEVDFHWAEIAEVVSNIEELFEATDFPQRELAAAVASKVRGCPVVYRCTPQRAWARLRLLRVRVGGRTGRHRRVKLAGCMRDRYPLCPVFLPPGAVRGRSATRPWRGAVL